jgi:hypothetical protein
MGGCMWMGLFHSIFSAFIENFSIFRLFLRDTRGKDFSLGFVQFGQLQAVLVALPVSYVLVFFSKFEEEILDTATYVIRFPTIIKTDHNNLSLSDFYLNL